MPIAVAMLELLAAFCSSVRTVVAGRLVLDWKASCRAHFEKIMRLLFGLLTLLGIDLPGLAFLGLL